MHIIPAMPNYREANFKFAQEMLPPAAWARLKFFDKDNAQNVFKSKFLEAEKITLPMKTQRANGAVDDL